MSTFADPVAVTITFVGLGGLLCAWYVGASRWACALIPAGLVAFVGYFMQNHNPSPEEMAIVAGISAVALVFGVVGALVYQHGPREVLFD